MSYTNLFVPSNSDSETEEGIGTTGKLGKENAETIDKVNRSIIKSEGLLASVPESNVNGDEGDEDVFVDVENTASWTKQNISFCGLTERPDSSIDLTTKSDGDESVQNNLDLNSNNLASDISANGVPGVRSDDKRECDGFEQNNSETSDMSENVTLVEISIENDSYLSNVISPVKTPGPSADAAFELQSNSSGTGLSVQTDVSIATKSDENLSVDTEHGVQSTGSDTGVSLNILSSARSDENASVQSDPEIEASLKSDDSKASLAVNVSRSIRSEDSFDVEHPSDKDVILLLEDRKADVLTNGRTTDALEEKTPPEAESEFDEKECKGSISQIMETREVIGKTSCGVDNSGDPLLQLESNTDASSINDVSDVSTTENIVEKLDSESENASDPKAEMNENLSDAKEIIDEKLKIESAASVHLRTEEFKRDEAKNHPQKTEKNEDDRDMENVQFTWDFSTSAAIKDLSGGKTEETLEGKSEPGIRNDGKTFGQENDPSSDAGTNGDGKTENDPDMPASEVPETHNMLKIVDSPPQLTTKSLDILSSDQENQDIPEGEEMHNSKSFGIPNKKSSKNRSACSLVKHNNSVEIIRTKHEDDDTETDGDADEDEDEGIGYGFANKSSSSLGKHRDSVELLCGKRFDSGSSMQVQKLSFLNSAVADEQDESGATYQSRSGLLKIRDSVEIIGMGNEDMEIGDVSFESSSHHSPRSILKINKPRSKENAISNTRLVSWKDTTAETELENNFPDDAKQTDVEFSLDNKRGVNVQVVEFNEDKPEESALPTGAKKKPAKKPPLPKVGNLIKLFSSNKKIAFEATDSETMGNVQSEAQKEGCKETDTDEIKKTFTFWKKVCDSSVEENSDDKFKALENNGKKVNFEQKNLNIEIIETAKPILVECRGSESDSESSDRGATFPKKPHKFVDKFERTSTVPNPLFKSFPLPVNNVFVKDRVSTLERSVTAEQDGGNGKSARENP